MNRAAGSELVVVLAPAGRDARVACTLLQESGMQAIACANLGELMAAVENEAGMLLLTDDALLHADLRPLNAWVRKQPAWSDLPVVVLTSQGGSHERNPAAQRLTGTLANVSFVERPFHATTLISVARSSLRARRRQYQARERLDALREGEERLRLALEAGLLGTWELDLNTRQLVTSARCKAIFGRSPEDNFSHAELCEAVHAEDRARIDQAMADAVGVGDFDVACRCLWSDGSLHWVEIKGRVRRSGAGEPLSMAGVCADVTQRALTEREREGLLAELSAERAVLEQRVTERTADLARANRELREEIEAKQRAEEQLRQSQKIETMGQLVGGVAHDFNNLLMVILGSLELLGRRVSNDAGLLRLVDSAKRGAQRGAGLTQRLLAFARRQDLEPAPVNPAELVSGALELLQRSVGPLVQVRTMPAGDLPNVMVDRNQLEMALLNLAVNARDAMPEGGSITIGMQPHTIEDASDANLPPGEYVSVSVADTGAGMDEATLKKAIEPFFSTKGVGKGTGLGLSMVHGTAKQSGGAFVLKSEPGVGTVAELWLPVAHAPAANAVTAREPVKGRGSGTILMVDDDELVAQSTGAMLEDLGYTVVTFNSGQDALVALEAGAAPDLLLTDQAMPAMTGLELAAQVRQMRPALPILLATGFADFPSDHPLGLPKLTKPFSQDQLAHEVSKLLVSV
jgi:PAS domain S-box-containing protein